MARIDALECTPQRASGFLLSARAEVTASVLDQARFVPVVGWLNKTVGPAVACGGWHREGVNCTRWADDPHSTTVVYDQIIDAFPGSPVVTLSLQTLTEVESGGMTSTASDERQVECR